MELNVDPGRFVETNDPRVSVEMVDNAGNRARVWLDAPSTRKFADDLMAAVNAITPDHG